MSGTPGDVTANDFTSLSEAIEAADSATAAGIYTISLDAASGTIDLTGMIPEISLASGVTLDIVGNGTTLDGGGAEPGLFV